MNVPGFSIRRKDACGLALHSRQGLWDWFSVDFDTTDCLEYPLSDRQVQRVVLGLRHCMFTALALRVYPDITRANRRIAALHPGHSPFLPTQD
jgi:hypothetical protein